MPRKSFTDFTPLFVRSSLSGGSTGGNIVGSSRSGGRRGPPTPVSPAPRKVIQVALQQPVQLHTAENAWKPTALQQDMKMKTTSLEQLQTEVQSHCQSVSDPLILIHLLCSFSSHFLSRGV